MGEAEDEQGSPDSNIEPFTTASLAGRFAGVTGQIGP
jgi:hypothetical protein